MYHACLRHFHGGDTEDLDPALRSASDLQDYGMRPEHGDMPIGSDLEAIGMRVVDRMLMVQNVFLTFDLIRIGWPSMLIGTFEL